MQIETIKEVDYRYFFSVHAFFLEFYYTTNTRDEEHLSLINEMITLPYVVLCFKRIQMYRDEKNFSDLMLCVTCLKFTLLILKRMQQCVTEGEEFDSLRRTSVQLQSQIFYEESYLMVVGGLFRAFHGKLIPKEYICIFNVSHLECLVETLHVLISLLDGSESSTSGLVVRKQQRKSKGSGSDDECIDLLKLSGAGDF